MDSCHKWKMHLQNYLHLPPPATKSFPPSTGSKAISPHTHTILNKIWKAKTIPPLLKTFAWRLFRHSIPTAERAGRFSTNIDKLCIVCNQTENDSHLFFLCHLPQQIWAATNTTPFLHLIDPTADGIQQILPHLFPITTNEQTFTKILLTLWYIWKAKNDHRFQRKTWTFLQVLHAVSAHFHSNQMAWGEPSPPSMENRLFVTSPSTMQGLRCYTDASTTPDLLSNGIRPAGIGIFITNTQIQPPLFIYLKAAMNDTPSVFVAEAATLAFGATLLNFMQLNPVNFLTDNQLLYLYINSTGHFDIPDWRAAAYT
jgi:hypothetical protein